MHNIINGAGRRRSPAKIKLDVSDYIRRSGKNHAPEHVTARSLPDDKSYVPASDIVQFLATRSHCSAPLSPRRVDAFDSQHCLKAFKPDILFHLLININSFVRFIRLMYTCGRRRNFYLRLLLFYTINCILYAQGNIITAHSAQ